MDKYKFIKIGFISIVAIVLLFVLLFLKNANFNFDVKQQHNIKSTNSYINKGNYINVDKIFDSSEFALNYRNVEYIGGINYDLQRDYNLSNKEEIYNGIRWYPFYRDKDTGEILRGLETMNYVTAGIPFVGLDHYETSDDKKTKSGFSEYVKKWTGSIIYANYSRSENSKADDRYAYDKSKGIYYCESYDYDKPIDLLVSDIWFNTKYIKRNETYDIDSIEKAISRGVYKNSIDGITIFSENDWILNILRNTFGYISDDFYDIVYNNKINFNEISLKECSIGDIGIYQKNDGTNCMGICIGYDKKKNPIFSVCSSLSVNKNIKELRNINNYIGYTDMADILSECKGYNVLHIEKEDISNKAFDKYYSTNLPFIDKNTSQNTIYDDIDKYNNQILYKQLSGTNWTGNNLYNQFIQERKERLINRENKATDIRKKYNLDIKRYSNEDITSIFFINEINSYDFVKLIDTKYNTKNSSYYNITEDTKRKTDYEKINIIINRMKDIENSLTEVEIEKIYVEMKNSLYDIVVKNKNVIKNMNDKELKKWAYEVEKVNIVSELLIRYIKENPDILK